MWRPNTSGRREGRRAVWHYNCGGVEGRSGGGRGLLRGDCWRSGTEVLCTQELWWTKEGVIEETLMVRKYPVEVEPILSLAAKHSLISCFQSRHETFLFLQSVNWAVLATLISVPSNANYCLISEEQNHFGYNYIYFAEQNYSSLPIE